MRIAAVAIFAVLLTSPVAHAACDPAGADAAEVAAARAAIAAACDCENAPNHGTFVRCARAVAKSALSDKSCVAAVMRCENRSTCGKPGAVACCQTSPSGITRASIRGKASSCRAPRRGSACVSAAASACDACTASGCAPAPTPDPAPTPGCGNGIVDPGEDCDGPTCTVPTSGGEVQSTCGAPGTLHACECQGRQCGNCGGGSDLCWSSDVCWEQPAGCIQGTCIATVCESMSDCSDAAPGCENGLCCAPPRPGAICRIEGMFELPCCGAAICPAGSINSCCLPSGAACTSGEVCCGGGSCTNGSCP